MILDQTDNFRPGRHPVNNQEAKEILWLYRPGVDDADPQFAEALAHAAQHPEVRQWLDEQCAVYAALRAKAKDIPVPADLPEQILAECQVVRPVVWWRSQFALGAAAVIVIGLSLSWIMFQLGLLRGRAPAPRTDFAAFRQEMVYFAVGSYSLDVKSTSLDELRQQFVRNGWPSDYAVPPGLTTLAVRGGCLTKWNNHKVSMLCLSAADNHKVWLYVIAHSAVSDAPSQSTPRIATEYNLSTASWSEGNKTYLLTAEGNEVFLRSLL